MVDTMLIEIEQYDRVCILRCKGRLVAGPDMDYLQAKMDEIKRLACSNVLADFEDVACIGSMGVTFIVGIYTSVIRRQGGRFLLTGVSPQVRHILDLTRLSSVIPMAPDLASGLSALRVENPAGSMPAARNASAN